MIQSSCKSSVDLGQVVRVQGEVNDSEEWKGIWFEYNVKISRFQVLKNLKSSLKYHLQGQQQCVCLYAY